MNCLAKWCFNLQHQTDHDINCAPQSVSMSQIRENNAIVQDFSVNNIESRTEKERPEHERFLELLFHQYGLYWEMYCCKMQWDDLGQQNIAVLSSELAEG